MTLYRTYRPARFADLIGQPVARTLLQRAVFRGRISHAYLFTGPRGTGKTSSARMFARAVCCTDPLRDETEELLEPCGKCAACLAISNEETVDFLEIDAASNRGIDDIRALREQVQYPPQLLARKIYLIDEVHMLSGDAFNALLKTLEEPPAHALFLLATTELHKVPLTVRSRCQIIRFEPATLAELTAKLERIIASESFQVEAGVPELIARQAGGAFRDAEALLEALTTSHQPLSLAQARERLGLLDDGLVNELIHTMRAGATQAAVAMVRDHPTPDQLTLQLIQACREGLRTDAAATNWYRRAVQELLEASLLMRHSPIPGLPLEVAVASLSDGGPGGSGPVGEPDIPSPRAEQAAPAAPRVAAQEITSPIVASPVTSDRVPVVELRERPTPHSVRAAWKQMVEQVQAENVMLGQILRDTTLHTAEEGVITVFVRFRFHADKLTEPKAYSRLTTMIKELHGEPWKIVFVAKPEAAARPARQSLGATVSDAAAVFGTTK